MLVPLPRLEKGYPDGGLPHPAQAKSIHGPRAPNLISPFLTGRTDEVAAPEPATQPSATLQVRGRRPLCSGQTSVDIITAGSTAFQPAGVHHVNLITSACAKGFSLAAGLDSSLPKSNKSCGLNGRSARPGKADLFPPGPCRRKSNSRRGVWARPGRDPCSTMSRTYTSPP